MCWNLMPIALLCLSIARSSPHDLGIFVEDCEDNTSGLKTLVSKLKATANTKVFYFPCNNVSAVIPKVCSFPQSASRFLYGITRKLSSYKQLSFIFKEIEFNSTRSERYLNLRQLLSMSNSSYKDFVYDIAQEYKWNYIFVYVDGNYGNYIPRCNTMRASGKLHCHFALLATSELTNTMDFLLMTRTESRSHYRHNFIVACDDSRTIKLIEQASLLGMLDNEYYWLLLNDGTERVMRALRAMQIDSKIRLARPIQRDKFEIILSQDTRTLFSRQSNATFFVTEPLRPDSYNAYCVQSESTLLNPHKNTTPVSEDHEIEIVDVMAALIHSKNPHLQRVATWKPATGFKTKELRQQLNHFEGVHFKVATINTPPYVFVNETSGEVTGYLVELLDIISIRLNFSYTFMPVPDREYGRLVNGSFWTGIIGEITRGEADLGVANLTPTGERSTAVRFLTANVAVGGYRLLYRRPEAFEKVSKVNAFVNPFRASCWLGISLMLFPLGFLACWTFNNYHKQTQRRSAKKTKETSDQSESTSSNNTADEFRIRNCVFIALQAAAQQGFSEVPDVASSRVIFISMWFFSLLVMASYSATLTSYYTFTGENLPFTSLAEFLKQTEYKIAYLKGTSYIMLMSKAKSGEFWEISQILASDPRSLVDDIMKGHERAASEKYVFAHDQQTLRWLASRTCGMVVVGPTYFRAGVTFAVPLNSTFYKDLSLTIAYLWEDGLMSRLQKKWWPKPLDCSTSNDKFQSITADDVLFPFLLLSFGIIVGTGTIIMENCNTVLSRCSWFPPSTHFPLKWNVRQSHSGQKTFAALKSKGNWSSRYRQFRRSRNELVNKHRRWKFL